MPLDPPLTQQPSWWTWMDAPTRAWLHPRRGPTERHALGWAACLRLSHSTADSACKAALADALACGIAREWLAEELLQEAQAPAFRAVVDGHPHWFEWTRSFPDPRLRRPLETEAHGNLHRRDECTDLPSLMAWVVARAPGGLGVRAALTGGWDPRIPCTALLHGLLITRIPERTDWTPLAIAIAHGNGDAVEALWADERVRLDQDSLDDAFFLTISLLDVERGEQDEHRDRFLATGAHWVIRLLDAGANPNRAFRVSRFGRSRIAAEEADWAPDTGGRIWAEARLHGLHPCFVSEAWPSLFPRLTPASWPTIHEEDPFHQAVRRWTPPPDHLEVRQALDVLCRTNRPTTALDMAGRMLAHLLNRDGQAPSTPDMAALQANGPRSPDELRRAMLPHCSGPNGAWPLAWAVAQCGTPLTWDEACRALEGFLTQPHSGGPPRVRLPPASLADHMAPHEGNRWRILHAEVLQATQGENGLFRLSPEERDALRLRAAMGFAEDQGPLPRCRL